MEAKESFVTLGEQIAVLEADDRAVRVADHDHVPMGMAVPPLFYPEVINVMRVDIRQQRRDDRPLWRAGRAFRPCAVFQNPRFQPFADETRDPLAANPVFEEAHQPAVADGVEERPDTGIQHGARLPPVKSRRQGVQRIVLAASGAEPMGEPGEIRLVNGVQHGRHRALDDLVLQRGDTGRAQAPVRLGDILAPGRKCPVCAPLDPSAQVRQTIWRARLVLVPCHAINPWGGGPLQLEEGPVQ